MILQPFSQFDPLRSRLKPACRSQERSGHIIQVRSDQGFKARSERTVASSATVLFS